MLFDVVGYSRTTPPAAPDLFLLVLTEGSLTINVYPSPATADICVFCFGLVVSRCAVASSG